MNKTTTKKSTSKPIPLSVPIEHDTNSSDNDDVGISGSDEENPRTKPKLRT